MKTTTDPINVQGPFVRSFAYELPALDVEKLHRYPARPSFFWTNPSNERWLGLGSALEQTDSGLSRITGLISAVSRLRSTPLVVRRGENPPEQSQPRFFGALSFRPVDQLEEPWKDFHPLQFFLPQYQFHSSTAGNWLTVNRITRQESDVSPPDSEYHRIRQFLDEEATGEAYDAPRIKRSQDRPEKPQWIRRVTEALRRIKNGQFEKIVLGNQRRLELSHPLDLNRLIGNLNRYQPWGYDFLFRSRHGSAFAGLSPEKLLGLSGRTVETESLAGTVSAEATFRNDDQSPDLDESSKNKTEHHFVSQKIRRVLRLLTDHFESTEQTVRSLPEVQHLLSTFQGKLKGEMHVLDVLRRLHPTPAVGGYPTASALDHLEELDSPERGLYSGPVGWFDLDGNGEFAVGIRSTLLRGNRCYLFTGAGIVEGSVPENEWQELSLKQRSILRFLPLEQEHTEPSP